MDDRQRAYSRATDLFRQQKKYDAAVDAMRKQLELPSDVVRQKSLAFGIAEAQAAGGKIDAAVATLTDLAGKWPDDADTVVQANLNMATYFGREKQYVKAAEAMQAAFNAMGADEPRAADTLWNVSQNYWAAEQWEKAAAAASQLIDERFRAWPRGQNGEANDRVIQAYVKLKQPEKAIAALAKWEASDPNPVFRQRWCLRGAQTAAAAGDQAKALEAYRRLFTAHAAAASSEGWWDAQNAITDATIAKDPAEGLKQAHVLIDAAGEVNQLTAATLKISDLLQKVDGNKKRAREFVAFQLFGPDGKDKKPGTADDGKDVLKDIAYPADAERNAAFAKAFAEVGDDAAAVFHRGQMCLYSGKPAAAYALFAEATRRAGHDQWATYAGALAMNGLRVNRGYGGVDEAVKWLQSGEGEDPFKVASASAPWPAPSMSAADKQNVVTVLASLQGIALDPSLAPETRAAALRGAGRAIEALGVTPSAEPFYELTDDKDPRPVHEAAVALILRLERGGELHAGKVKAFLSTDKLPGQASKRADAEFKRATKPLDRLANKGASIPKVQPIKE